MSPIQMGLQDAHPYVRRTAVMGVLKVYHLDKAAVRNAGGFSYLATVCATACRCVAWPCVLLGAVKRRLRGTCLLTSWCCQCQSCQTAE